jgi:hypothetical protein
LTATDALKIVCSPVKVLKKAVQTPSYLAPLLVLVLFVVAQFSVSYIVLSRSYVEQTVPTGLNGDLWTENATLWSVNEGVTVHQNFLDYVNGTYYGNSSIEFTALNSEMIRAEIRLPETSVDCSSDGFRNVTFRVKLYPGGSTVKNASLRLLSLNDSYFVHDLTEEFQACSTMYWNNITLPVGGGEWQTVGSTANWQNITGVVINVGFNESSVTLRLDGLFFKSRFRTPLEINAASYLANSVLNAFTQYIMRWLILTGLVYFILKGLKVVVLWKPLMVAVGTAFMTLTVQAIASIALAWLTLPPLYYPFEYWAGVPGESTAAETRLVAAVAKFYQSSFILQAVVYAWLFGLTAILVHEAAGFKWSRSLVVAFGSLSITVLVGLLLGF